LACYWEDDVVNISTVLILGAGASMPFGFPSGRKLLQTICIELEHPRKHPLGKLLIEFGHKEDLIAKFRRELYYSGRRSVDMFLENRPEFMEVGRGAIAAVLIRYENEDKLFNIAERAVNWYEYLYNKIANTFDDFDKNRLSIITYNYDRSLEHFLFTTLKHSFDKSDEECAKKLGKIPIIHLHGQLGYLPWQDPNGRPYESKSDVDNLRKSVEGIKIICEGVENEQQFRQAYELLQDAPRIYFMGFGYDETNIKRLNLFTKSTNFTNRSIWGATMGFVGKELDEIKGKCSGHIKLADSGYDVLSFFRNCARLN